MPRQIRVYVGAPSTPVALARIVITELKAYIIPPIDPDVPPGSTGFGRGLFGQTPFGS
jgi:hypothetical protein